MDVKDLTFAVWALHRSYLLAKQHKLGRISDEAFSQYLSGTEKAIEKITASLVSQICEDPRRAMLNWRPDDE